MKQDRNSGQLFWSLLRPIDFVANICNASPRSNAHELQSDPFKFRTLSALALRRSLSAYGTFDCKSRKIISLLERESFSESRSQSGRWIESYTLLCSLPRSLIWEHCSNPNTKGQCIPLKSIFVHSAQANVAPFANCSGQNAYDLATD